MNHFITFRDTDETGELRYYVLQRKFPHYVGLLVSRPIEGALANAAIGGYFLWITFGGTLAGNMIPGHRDVKIEIEEVFHNMASWYLSERIQVDEKKYKKWKMVNQ